MKGFDLFSFVDRENEFTERRGVFYKEGFAYVTDGRFAIKVEKKYPSELEGKIVADEKTSALVDTDSRFPNINSVIPNISDMEEVKFDLDEWRKELQKMKKVLAFNARVTDGSYQHYAKINGIVFQLALFKKALHFASYFSNCKLYMRKDPDEREFSPAMLTDGTNVFLCMPYRNATAGFNGLIGLEKSTFRSNSFESTLISTGYIGVLQRIRNRSQTEEDVKTLRFIKEYFKTYAYTDDAALQWADPELEEVFGGND